jgi:NADH-quinone oxidoreductase subunit B
MEGLTLLQASVGKERRPLSWAAGAQQVIMPEKISMHELKRSARMSVTTLPSPDHV